MIDPMDNALTLLNAIHILQKLRENKQATISKSLQGWDYDMLAYSVRDLLVGIRIECTYEANQDCVTLHLKETV